MGCLSFSKILSFSGTILKAGVCFSLTSSQAIFAQQVPSQKPSPILAAEPLAALVPEACLSNGRSRGGIDVILVPASDLAAYEARGLMKVSCGRLDRRIYQDRLCRAAYGRDEIRALREFGRTIGELGALCDAATRVLGPQETTGTPKQQGGGN
jgi:hypothetical protein